jgi:translocation and assembly module TamB
MQDQIKDKKRRKKIIRFLYLLFFSIIIGLVILFTRGPNISNILKKAILPELEVALQQKVIAKKIYINIFPLFIEAKDIKVFDENGTRILFAKRVKGYIEPLGLLQKRISIRRLVIKEPDLSSDKGHLDKVIENVKAYLKKESEFPFKVRIKVVEVSEGAASLQAEDLKTFLGIKGFSSEVILSKNPKLTISIKQFDVRKEGLPELTGDITALLVLRQNEIEIKKLIIGSYGSEIKAAGLYSNGKGTLKSKVALVVDSMKRILHLKQKGEGKIFAEGEIQVENLQHPDFSLNRWGDISINLQLKGDFYIQTLMEVLKVQEKIEGLVDFQGEIKGKLSDISGQAKARLRKGNLFGVEIDTLRCEVTYDDGLMRFTNADADLYNGHAKAEASINLPIVEPFTLNIQFDSIDSKDAFKLIGWEPPIPTGKVKGELLASGDRFDPDGWFIYNSQKSAVSGQQSRKSKDPGLRIPAPRLTGENVLDRIQYIKGAYSLRGNLLSLSDLQLRTPFSDLGANGTIDITKRTMDFTCRFNTKEVSDLIVPYYTGLKGQANFSGRVTGMLDDPEISGRASSSGISVEDYRISQTASLFNYHKNLLHIQELILTTPGEEHRVKGRILFPEAKELFDFSRPVYELSASFRNADLGGIMHTFSLDIPAKGRVNADLKIGGKDNIEIDGNAYVTKSTIYKIPVDSASIAFSFLNKELYFKKVILKQGLSTLIAEGKISSDERFSFTASSDKILIKDLGVENIPEGASLIIQSEGQGTLKNPVIILNARVAGGIFKDKAVGDGVIKGEIRDKNILLNASLFDKKINFRGKGHLDDTLPWNAEVEIQPGRYDFLLGSIFGEILEDVSLNFKGHADMEGDRDNIKALLNISNLTIALFDYSFSNDSGINVLINNGKISFPAFSIRSSGTSSVKVSGGLEIGRDYNLRFEGRSSLAPLKLFYKRLEHLSGEAEFAFSILGKWENPDIKGDLTLSNTSLGLKGNLPRISSISGTAYIDEDKLLVKKLSGKVGGGEINMSGLLHLKGFHIKRFSFEASLDNITASFARNSPVNFNGNLVYKGSPEAQGISGDIKIKSAKYRDRIEWKSWLLKTKSIEKPRAGLSGIEEAVLNVSISGEENIYIDNNVARTPVKVDVIVRGTVSQPVLFGRLESKEGVFYFRNNEFKIVHASADFADPNRLNPVIELSAESSIKGYHVKLNLEGQIEQFNLSLSSNPPLEEPDILSLLTVGEVGSEMKGLKGGIGAGQASSFLAGTLQDVFEERLKAVTGFDRIQVGSSVSKTSGSVEPRVTVSKRLLSDKVFVTYSNVLGSTTTGEQIFKIEYLLDKNISLIGTSDERGIVGGDIKFRFEFR